MLAPKLGGQDTTVGVEALAEVKLVLPADRASGLAAWRPRRLHGPCRIGGDSMVRGA